MDMENEKSSLGSLLDHGMSAASKSAHQLALAVNSIPAYARASSLMLVLTPFIRHKDRGNICSFQSWRKRGWCRLEGDFANGFLILKAAVFLSQWWLRILRLTISV